MHAFRNSVFAVVTFLPMLAGCGTDAAANAGRQAGAVTAAEPAEVVIRARDNVFFEAPDTLVAGVTNVRLINEGPTFHHAWLVRLDEGKTVNDLIEHLQTRAPMPSWAIDVGGPNAPGGPGQESAALVTFEPGTYALVCAIDLPDRVPHFMKGMVRQITVVPSEGPAAVMPPADVVMTLNDYSFDTDVPITAGRRTIRIENAAAQPHEVLIVKLEEGRTIQEFMEFVSKPEGVPPGRVLGGVTGLATGEVNQVALDFEAGDYGLVCFVSDAGDGRPHYLHGMVQQIHVM
ncbi:MAG TPA: hypothetical protein VFZ69_09445 [Longimicrobiales bacterium]